MGKGDVSTVETLTHRALVLAAERFLWAVGCGVAIREFVAVNGTGEIPDAIGWRGGVSILIEAKVSRADYLRDAKKSFRKVPESGMGDWRFYLCTPGLIMAHELPPGWGLLHYRNGKARKAWGGPQGNSSWYQAPNAGNKRAENAVLYSAIRRLTIRGHLEQIYESPFKDRPAGNDPRGTVEAPGGDIQGT